MTEVDDLTLAYLRGHPEEAARELERQPVTAGAALLTGLPARTTGPVVAAMRPQAAASLLRELDRERAVLLLGTLAAPAAAAVLRLLPEETRLALLALMPTAQAIACRALLRFPADSVGACMQTTVPMLGDWMPAAEALEALVRAERDPTGVLVIDSSQRLVGWISAVQLLRTDAGVRLGALAGPIASLPALTPVAAALDSGTADEAWLAAVVGQDRRLLGAVTAAALRQAARGAAAAEPPEWGATFGLLAAQYWRAVAALADTAVETLLTPERRRS